MAFTSASAFTAWSIAVLAPDAFVREIFMLSHSVSAELDVPLAVFTAFSNSSCCSDVSDL